MKKILLTLLSIIIVLPTVAISTLSNTDENNKQNENLKTSAALPVTTTSVMTQSTTTTTTKINKTTLTSTHPSKKSTKSSISATKKTTSRTSSKKTKITSTTIQIESKTEDNFISAKRKDTISYLTPPESLKLNGNVPASYKRKIAGTASAYHGDPITATGKTPMPGYVAVNPRQIPYHTKMWIVSNDGKYVYGYASAEDTGGFINWTGSRATLCDLYMASEAACERFGRRGVTIYIL